VIPIHHLRLPNRDFIFELGDKAPVSFYSYLVDTNFYLVVVCIKTDKPVAVSKNTKLGTLCDIAFDIAFDNCFYTEAHMADLAMRSPVGSRAVNGHRNISNGVGPIRQDLSANEAVLPNRATVYRDETTVQAFSSLLDEFSDLFKDSGFVNLPKEQWMRIPPHSDWESKVTGKAKIYLLGIKDRALVDQPLTNFRARGALNTLPTTRLSHTLSL
jgi:hypothetical protein